jgi:diguanylate cyclase (GGDEF)-like protein/PAS domain S-box-containing protein
MTEASKSRGVFLDAANILKHLDEAIIVTDDASSITYMNPAAENLTGWKNEEAAGKKLSEVFEPIFGESSMLIDDLPSQLMTSHLRTKSGTHVEIESRISSLKDDLGKSSGYVTIFRDLSDQKMAEEALKQSRENLKQLIQSVNGIVWESDLQRNSFSFISNQVIPILGYAIEEWLNKPGFWAEHIASEDAEAVRDVERIFVTGRKRYVLKYRLLSAKGNLIWVKDHVHVIYQNNVPTRLRGVMEDITAEKDAEKRLYESQERYRMLVDSAPDIIFSLSTTSGLVTMLNPAFEKITGIPANDWIGNSFLGLIHPDDVGTALALYERTISGAVTTPVELRFRSKSDQYLYGEITTVATVRDNKCVAITGIIRDITDRKISEQKLIRSAFYDALTGLPNRALLMDRLRHAILKSRRKPQEHFAVLFIDLDRFKVVNDSLGHRLGDELLVDSARRLEGCLRAEDTVARIGGDEFVLLLGSIRDLAEAQEIAGRIHQAFSVPFQIGGQEFFTSASIGIALNSPKYERPEEILRDADLAMYRAKNLGRARSEVFDTVLHSQAMSLLEMETDLRHSLERNEFRILYQPIIELSSGRVCGMEALLRWDHPRRGMISAPDFMHLAEDTGLVHAIGENVLLQACRQLREWQKAFGDSFEIGVSVNLSAKQFSNPGLLNEVLHILERTEVDPSRLALEITETVLMENRSIAEDLIDGLHHMQVKLHVDDFGTGYSSLSYLRRFPVDALKIDRSFIQAIHENSEIVRTILTLARNLKIQAIAEGVETEQQLKELLAIGCQYGQGYLFSEPLAADIIPARLESLQQSSALRTKRNMA